MLRRRAPIAACIGALVFGFAACDDDATGHSTGPFDGRQADESPRASAPDDRIYAVGYRDVSYVDRSRPTAPNGDDAGAPDRTLAVRVWYPAPGEAGGEPLLDAPPAAGGDTFPLVLFSHGYTASGPAYGPLTSPIAAAGYVVAAPTFPLTNGAAPGGPALVDVFNQPADASFVIDQVLADPAFAPMIDAEHIAAAGHSLGAITTLGLGLASCCADQRLDAVVAYSGLSLLGPDSFAEEAPLLLVHGDTDGIVPYQGSLGTFAEAVAPKFLVTLLGGGHDIFGGGADQAQVIVASTVDFIDLYLEDDADALDRLRHDADVPGVSTLEEVA